MKKLLRSLPILFTLTLCGCVYHPTINQGNILTPEKMQSIHNGMTSAQVVSQLGTPVLRNVFADNRMRYIYTTQESRKKMVIKKLEIDFQNDRVVNVRTWL